LPDSVIEAKVREADEKIAELKTQLESISTAPADAKAQQALRDEIARLEKARPALPTLPVMDELAADKRRTTHILIKGNFLDPGEKVDPGAPAAFHPFPRGAPVNRLGLAQWLIDPANPLTARVAVNRFWAQLFGTGLVETEEDFGTQGAPPTHP